MQTFLYDKFLEQDYRGPKYTLYANGYTMEFRSKEIAEAYQKAYGLGGYIVKENFKLYLDRIN